MSNSDSFIEEVSEEVRRDRLYAALKKWGWLGVLIVLLAVGGASFNEWRKAQDRAAAQGFGDALLAALDTRDMEAAASAALSIETTLPGQDAVAKHLAAAAALASDQSEVAIEALGSVQANADISPIYRELAAFKAAMALPPDTPAQERMDAFEAITGSFRALAQEQKALVMIANGDTDGAVEVLRTLSELAEATPGVRRRTAELIVALGADISDSDAQ
ncbi:MAG: hypothetical protein AAF700_02765 [Pseudomonadota bacterium]